MTSVPGPESIDDLLDRVHVVALPMRVRFRGITERELVLIDGPAGWGEFGPFGEYHDPEAAHWLASAIEMAWQGPPPPVRSRVAVNATVPAVAAGEVGAILDRFPGCSTVKVKVAEKGQQLVDDVARVAAVLQARPGARVRVDANGAWSVAEAAHAVRVLDQAVRAADVSRAPGTGPVSLDGPGLEYVEQPCATVDELVELRERLAADGVHVDVAADESIRRAEDPLRVVRAGGADRAVVKVAPLGGPRRLLAVAAELGVPVTVSSALDSAVGVAAGVAAAAALPGVGARGGSGAAGARGGSRGDDDDIPAAGLGTGGFFVEDVVDPGVFALEDGHLPVRQVAPDPARLEELRIGGERRDWWLDRIRRCHAIL
ncbi:o-succinylbenzoate synthase [Dietzia cinnamea]|uniref:o-succinylbenzoate synthase n=1 Tax=Dietzia cinnamea TaxID=321318 RepID=UPI0021A8AAE0|nr:o-succinylbenzoate synthase [Dietzia cinnamea]MCT1639531.1 o-succinylbenzoate synthase [Dietzia cinnamea]